VRLLSSRQLSPSPPSVSSTHVPFGEALPLGIDRCLAASIILFIWFKTTFFHRAKDLRYVAPTRLFSNVINSFAPSSFFFPLVFSSVFYYLCASNPVEPPFFPLGLFEYTSLTPSAREYPFLPPSYPFICFSFANPLNFPFRYALDALDLVRPPKSRRQSLPSLIGLLRRGSRDSLENPSKSMQFRRLRTFTF